MSIDAMKQALELLESAHVATDLVWKRHDCITALRAAIEQPKQNRAKEMRDAGYTRRPTLREFPREDAQPEQKPEPPSWWPAVENILNQYGLQAIDFVADFKEAMKQAEQEPVAWVYPEGLEALRSGKPWTAYGSNGYSRIPLYLNDAVAPTAEPRSRGSGAGFESLPASPNQPEQRQDTHEDWCASLTQLLMSMPPKPAPCNCKLKTARRDSRQWQGLTAEELNQIYAEPQTHAGQYARAIEAKLREKNT